MELGNKAIKTTTTLFQGLKKCLSLKYRNSMKEICFVVKAEKKPRGLSDYRVSNEFMDDFAITRLLMKK